MRGQQASGTSCLFCFQREDRQRERFAQKGYDGLPKKTEKRKMKGAGGIGGEQEQEEQQRIHSNARRWQGEAITKERNRGGGVKRKKRFRKKTSLDRVTTSPPLLLLPTKEAERQRQQGRNQATQKARKDRRGGGKNEEDGGGEGRVMSRNESQSPHIVLKGEGVGRRGTQVLRAFGRCACQHKEARQGEKRTRQKAEGELNGVPPLSRDRAEKSNSNFPKCVQHPVCSLLLLLLLAHCTTTTLFFFPSFLSSFSLTALPWIFHRSVRTVFRLHMGAHPADACLHAVVPSLVLCVAFFFACLSFSSLASATRGKKSKARPAWTRMGTQSARRCPGAAAVPWVLEW